MPDQLLVNVPRQVEDEPGYRSSELLWERGAALAVSRDAAGNPTAYREPISGRWLGVPAAPASTEDGGDWTCETGQSLGSVSNAEAGGGGPAVTAEGELLAPWVVKRNEDLEPLRGFWLDLLIHAPEDQTLYTEPVRIEWGDRWRLELRGNEQGGATTATLYERSAPSATEDGAEADPWRAKAVLGGLSTTPLLKDKFFNTLHRLWVQPLDSDEFLIRNRDHDLGAVVRMDQPVKVDTPRTPADGEEAPPQVDAPWGAAPLRVSGMPRAWWVLRPLRYPAAWHVETEGKRRLGYASTQDVEKTFEPFLPDGLPQDDPDSDEDDETASEYAATLTVYADELDGDEWAEGADTDAYAWRIAVTGPEDAATGWSKRAVVLAQMALEWPATTASDGLSAVDLFTAPGVDVLALSEERAWRDADSRLSVVLRGSRATLAPWAKPNTRVQWIIDTADGEVDGEGEPLPAAPYLRFDGLREAADEPVWVPVDGGYMQDLHLTVRSRFRQAGVQMLRQAVPLDGLTRAEAYRKLAEQFPLITSAETAGGTDALEFEVALAPNRPKRIDETIPKARRGEKPAWQPRIGANLLDVLLDLQRTLGTTDRLRFVDRGASGTGGRRVVLYVDQPAQTSAAAFYRSSAAAVAAGVPGQVIEGGDKGRLVNLGVSDADFCNEVYVVGQSKDDQTKLFVAHAAYPPSWKSSSNPLYIGVRKTVVVVRPELNTQQAVDGVCRDLAEEVMRFRAAAQMESHLVPTLYPGDRVTLDAGSQPGAVDTLYEIRGMRTVGVALGTDAPFRYRCTYELAEVRP